MNKLIFPILLSFCFLACAAHGASYGVASTAAPVLNTAAFSSVFGGADGKALKTDRCGQVRELEFIALPGTVFSILDRASDGNNTILRVVTDEYPLPADAALFVDSRFVKIMEAQPQSRVRTLPPKPAIIAALQASAGVPYVWGGNVQGGVAELIELFYAGDVPAAARRRLTLAGLDCSGLLYQATGGWTPRNTSQLLSFGKEVRISGRTAKEISGLLEPLDLIVWNGHVLIVLDRNTIIESRLVCGDKHNGGVKTTTLRQRLAEIMRTRRPADQWPAAGKRGDVFVVRRWFPQ